MKNNPKEKLLQEVLNEGTEGIRKQALKESLRELRKRKAGYNSQRWTFPLALAASVVLLVSLAMALVGKRATPQVAKQPIQPGVQVVLVGSYPPMTQISTKPTGIELVQNGIYPKMLLENPLKISPVEVLTDAELLALFPDKSPGLLADANGHQRLVFLER